MSLSCEMREFNNLQENILFTEKINMEKFMKKEADYKTPSQESQNRMRIIFQFPAKSSKDDLIKSEVKEIMTSTLQEQLHSLTS